MRKVSLWVGLGALLIGIMVAPGFSQGPPDFARAVAAQEAHTDRLLGEPGVVGTAVGLTPDGRPAVLIFTESPQVTGLPARLDGIPTVVKVTGRFMALHHQCGHDKPTPFTGDCPPPDGGGGGGGTTDCTSTTEECRPARIGQSSGSDRLITINGSLYCTTGTLGARVSGDGAVYTLSNAHVYALEGSEPDGTVIVGDPILQPGRVDLTDQACGSPQARQDAQIGTLADWVRIQFNNGTTCRPSDGETATCNKVDAAIAAVSSEDVGTATLANGYGQPKSTPLDVTASHLGLRVQKYGRTTALTKGSLQAVNATVNVCYDIGCAKFIDQLVVDGSKGPFIKGGDSGSLLVGDGGGHDRKPVGLLFAGSMSGKTGIANRIGAVLDAFVVSIDGE